MSPTSTSTLAEDQNDRQVKRSIARKGTIRRGDHGIMIGGVQSRRVAGEGVKLPMQREGSCSK